MTSVSEYSCTEGSSFLPMMLRLTGMPIPACRGSGATFDATKPSRGQDSRDWSFLDLAGGVVVRRITAGFAVDIGRGRLRGRFVMNRRWRSIEVLLATGLQLVAACSRRESPSGL